jgi:hypothetical protein
MLRRQIPTAMLLATVFALAASLTTLAKEQAIVTLDASLPSDPEPGSEITIGWTVETPGDDGERLPFNAEGMFFRLLPPSGEPVEAFGTQSPVGHYVATLTVPAGGIRAVEVGLRGESCTGDTCQRSDILFAIDDSTVPVLAAGGPASNPAAGSAADSPATTTTPGLGASDLQATGLLGLGLGVIAIVASVAFLRGRRRALTPG